MRVPAFILILAAAIAAMATCSSDDPVSSDPTTGAVGSRATLAPRILPMTGDEILEKTINEFTRAPYFEADITLETVRDDTGARTAQSGAVRFGGTGKYQVHTVDDGGYFELIALGRTYYTRRGESKDAASLDWTQTTAGGYGSTWDEVPEFFSGLGPPDQVRKSDGVYRLTGFKDPQVLYGGLPGIGFDMLGGTYTLLVDTETFAPLYIEYESTFKWTNDMDPENVLRWNVVHERSLDFTSFNELITIAAPASFEILTPPTPTPTTSGGVRR